MPQTTNQFVIQVPTGGVDKLDLLFMIDNSQSMGDKQALLRDAVPSLLKRFVQPLCLDERGVVTAEHSVGGKCSRGAPEFPALEDIHIAVISSSLGAFGAHPCADGTTNDKAWLLPRARSGQGLPSWNGSGFLAWDPTGKRNTPPGTTDAAELTPDFSDLVSAVGEAGCGYEASLESWYRFLIDPNPPESVKIDAQGRYTEAVGRDAALLAQRQAFLRPDSLVAIVMLSDENDCSFVSNGQAHLLTKGDGRMYRATSACATNPNDLCCRSCGTTEADTPAGCVKLADDPSCRRVKPDDPPRYELADDPNNLRCYDQKRRFGFDALEPVGKYIRGLTQPTVLDRDGVERPNPLLAPSPTGVRRDPGLVYLAGIIGVPWQDIASDDSLQGPVLRYLTAEELVAKQRWDVILGDPAQRRPPSDPHMVESVVPRSGTHPLRIPGADIAPSTATSPRADVISGHEYDPLNRADLQYACIYERETPDCATSACDCKEGAKSANTPLCQAPAGASAMGIQYFAKAYPSTRQLEVLRGIGSQGIVASICAKLARGPTSDPSYGYNPAVSALVERLRVPLANQCLGRAPALTESGRSACMVLEARLDGQCDCSQPGRKPASADVLSSVRGQLKGSYCDVADGSSCSTVCACQLAEASPGDAMTACRSTMDPNLQAPAYCYVEPAAGLGDPKLVEGCPETKQRLLRFVGPETPTPGSIAFMACMGVASQGGAL